MSEEKNEQAQGNGEEAQDEQVDEMHETDVDIGHAFRRDIESDEFATERPENDPENEQSLDDTTDSDRQGEESK